ncbi:SPFH domain-containing protein [Anaerolineales bacterium HSG24]|nr:SPFH domain-containing protein [Anaerolineales bacterium HSG24]
MEFVIFLIVASLLFTLSVTILSYFAQKEVGDAGYAARRVLDPVLNSSIILVIVGVLTLESVSAYIEDLVVRILGERISGWIGLPVWTVLFVITLILTGKWIASKFSKLTKSPKSESFAANCWYGYWTLSILSYLAGGLIGFLFIAIPNILLFLGGLYYISDFILPLPDKRKRVDQLKAFRCLITFSMGTNYPYYFVDDNDELKEYVKGNRSQQFFGGPGFVYTNCHQAVFITDDGTNSRVAEPGLTFTKRMEQVSKIIDLRPQVRAFPVETLTKDGIPTDVVTFVPVRIDQDDKEIELGKSFPFQKRAVYKALFDAPIRREQDKEKSGQKYEWNGGPKDGLIPLLGKRIMQDIISHYDVDNLCEPNDPRVKIADKMKEEIKKVLESRGLKLIGGGISNLMPPNGILERRLENWQTQWKAKIEEITEKEKTHRMLALGEARVDAEKEIVESGQNIEQNKDLQLASVLRFINSLTKWDTDKSE